jgi:hypothetical protein
MKKFIFLPLSLIMLISLTYAQKKNYVSIEYGITLTGMSNSIANNMKTNGFGDKLTFDFVRTLFDALNGDCRQYPFKAPIKNNSKIRYGYNIKANASVEAGFGSTYRTIVNGADANGKFANYLSVNCELYTAYAAWLLKNKKGNAAIGIGPAVSICSIKHKNTVSTITLSDKSYVLPGVIFTGYWNFINTKNWFMGLRSDMTIGKPVTTEAVRINNSTDKSFVSVSKNSTICTVTNTISVSAGIKF